MPDLDYDETTVVTALAALRRCPRKQLVASMATIVILYERLAQEPTT